MTGFTYDERHPYNKMLKSVSQYSLTHTDAAKFTYKPPQFVDGELALLHKHINNKKICRSLLDDNIHPIGELNNSIYLYDCSIGLPLIMNQGGVFLNKDLMTSAEHDVLETAYLRKRILGERLGITITSSNTFSALDLMGCNMKEIFSVPIPEYTVNTESELSDTINSIESMISTSKFFSKLWYRGQREEHFVARTTSSVEMLGFHRSYVSVPSLIPSLGRKVKSEEEFYKNLKNYNKWFEVYFIWLISHYTEFSNKMPHKYKEVMALLMDLESMRIYCSKLWSDHEMPEVVIDVLRGDDLLYDSGELCMQQYGALTSKLDITHDLDTALFFTQSRLDPDTNQYVLIDPTDTRVLYLFAQYRNSCTANISDDIFHLPLPWNCPIPLRIMNQNCGLLSGANGIHQNTYAHRIIAKIHLKGNEIVTSKQVDNMFPDTAHDNFYDFLKQAIPKLEGLYG